MRTATPPDVPGLISGGQARRRRRKAMWAGGTVLAAVIAAGGVYGVAQLDDDADSVSRITHQPTPQPLPDAAEGVAIEAGTYVVPAKDDDVVTPYTITVPAGWETQDGTSVGKYSDQPREMSVVPFALDQIRLTGDTCHGEQSLGTPQTSTASLVSGLRAQGSALRVSDPVADTVGGVAATRIDLHYPGRDPLSNCRLAAEPGGEPGVLQVWSGYFVLFPGESASVYVVEVGDRAQVFVTRTAADATTGDRAELQSVLASIGFRTGAE